jgi:hypothetical protein
VSKHILSVQAARTSAERDHPVGSVYHTHHPTEGFYKIVGYFDERPGTIGVMGELLMETSFGYPDDAFRGFLIASIFNKENTFGRKNGRWTLEAMKP